MRELVVRSVVIIALVAVAGFSLGSSRLSSSSGNDVQIGAYYYIWWGLPKPFENHWKRGIGGTPFLGEYNSSDPLTAERHIVWAKEHGIDFFAISWLGRWDYYDFDHINQNNLKEGFLKARNLKGFKFCLFYESAIVLDAAVKENLSFPEIFLADVEYASQTYFPREGYLRIDGQPVLFVFNVPYIYEKLEGPAARTMFDQLRQRFDVYVIGDIGSNPIPDQADQALVYSMDAVTSYVFSDVSSGWQTVLEDAERYYPQWKSAMNAEGLGYVPNAYPGFDNTAQNLTSSAALTPNPTNYQRMLKAALANTDAYSKMVMITSWNEWLESTQIEPSMEHGEWLLDAILITENSQDYRLVSYAICVAAGVAAGAVIVSLYYRTRFRK